MTMPGRVGIDEKKFTSSRTNRTPEMEAVRVLWEGAEAGRVVGPLDGLGERDASTRRGRRFGRGARGGGSLPGVGPWRVPWYDVKGEVRVRGAPGVAECARGQRAPSRQFPWDHRWHTGRALVQP